MHNSKNRKQNNTSMPSVSINKASLDFLKTLSKHNDREWFAKHKDQYTSAHENMIDFAGALLAEMNKHDNIETPSGKASLYRIYRDVRFSKEKTPYNTHWNGGFRRATKKLRGGYYFSIEPGNSFAACGFWGPSTPDLQRIRQDIDHNYKEWNKMLSGKTLKATFGSMIGDQLGTAPRGYAKDHPAIALLRYKQFLLKHDFTDQEVLSPDFVKKANDVFKKMRPFLDFMSEILTTDSNGVSIVD
jgi:uncharacterized protein (TIGR02453 family)